MSARDQSQAVPAATCAVPSRSAATTSAFAVRAGDHVVIAALVLVALLDDIERHTGFLRRLAHRLQQVRDHLVAVGGDANLLSGAHQVEDHARADVRLARAGRALDGEGAAVERDDEPARGIGRVLALAAERRAGRLAGARRAAQQEVARGAVRAVAVDAVLQHRRGDAPQRLALLLRRRSDRTG